MIGIQKALQIAKNQARRLAVEHVGYTCAVGRVLASDVFSDVDMPPFHKSAMDGYACRREDLGKALRVLEVIAAGKSPLFSVGAGQCSKIMTGARVPECADLVFKVEDSELLPDGKIRFTGEKTSSNICLQGEDLRTGDLVLPAGTLLKPQHIAMLAAVGATRPLVYCRPRVGVLSTGSELVSPDVEPDISQIRNSNGPQLQAQVEKAGGTACFYGIVPDDEHAIRDAILKSVEENDLTLVSGGVSVGDFDFVPQVIRELGFEIHFNRLLVKPGQHTTFASKGNKYIIGLPGNPVSSFIQFEIFVSPFLCFIQGINPPEVRLTLPMGQGFRRKKTDKEEYFPVIVSPDNRVKMVAYNGSAHIHAYHEAFGFIALPVGKAELKEGELVYVRPL